MTPKIPKQMQTYLWIAVGSALGGIARYWCSGVVARLIGESFPWGTLTAPDGRLFLGSTARLALMAGFCGGFTTFSSFSIQTLNLLNDGQYLYASGNAGLSVALCIAAVWAGSIAATGINAMRWT